MADTRVDFWNSPFYKPKIKLHPAFWEEFLRASYIVRELHRRDPIKYPDPEIYDVLNWMRQELHNELPFSEKRSVALDKQIEREFARNARRNSEQTSRGS